MELEVIRLGALRSVRGALAAVVVAASAVGVVVAAGVAPAGAVPVSDEAGLRAAVADADVSSIELTSNIALTDCDAGALQRPFDGLDLVISGAVTIEQTCAGRRVLQSANGAPASLTIRGTTITGGDFTDPLLALGGAIFWNGAVTLEDVTMTGNTATDLDGGGVGGAIFTNGLLTVRRSSLTANAVLSGDVGLSGGRGGAIGGNGGVVVEDSVLAGNTAGGGSSSGGIGGAIHNNGPVTVLRSTLVDNVAEVAIGGQNGSSGAVSTNASLTVINSTITGNTAEGLSSYAGGLNANGALRVFYSTVVGNSAANGANVGNLHNSDVDDDLLFASVLADPLGGGGNCGETSSGPISAGYNVADDDSCLLTATGDQEGVADVGLGALGDNGGPTQTMLPQAGSVLLDVIPPGDCRTADAGLDTDQRGVTRPQGTGCDVGAVEVEVAQATTTTTMPDPGDPATEPGGPPPAADPVVADPDYTG